MPFSSRRELDQVIEDLAQKKTKYEMLFEEQAAELRKDPAKCCSTYEQTLEWPDLVKPGDRWIPGNDAEKEENMRRMEEVCAMKPTSFEDRMKICFAAHGVLTYIVRLEINELPQDAQFKILRRNAELISNAVRLQTQVQNPSYHSITTSAQGRLTRPTAISPTFSISADEQHSFQKDPFQLIGRQFYLDFAEDDEMLYEVIEVGASKAKGRWYQVLFEGCVDPIEVGGQEMTEMLRDSVSLGLQPRL